VIRDSGPLTPRPRRAEQDFRAPGVDATPQRDAAPDNPRAYVRLRGRIPKNDLGPLLHAPAHLSPDPGARG